jgi:MYXO-CTERM domain-containing protein
VVVAASMTAALLVRGREASANGRLPASNQLVASPSDATFLALETTFGILVSHDSGASWNWICENAAGYGGIVQDPAIAMTQGGVMAATQEGLSVSLDRGCSWNLPITLPAVDIAARRDSSHTALALTSQPAGFTDGGDSLYTTQVHVTTDDGMTWAPLGAPIDPILFVETIDVATSDSHRIYISGMKRQPTSEGGIVWRGALLVSSDDGAHYTEYPIPLDVNEAFSQPFIAAVDPMNANRLYMRIMGDAPMRVLVSDDAGATFRVIYRAKGTLTGFALSPDGGKVYLGGYLDGVLEAPATTFQFVQKSVANVTCLTATTGGLYACMSDANYGPFVGVSPDDGATFLAKFYLRCVSATPSCSAQSSIGQCDAGDLASIIGNCSVPDGGPIVPGDAGASMGMNGGADASPRSFQGTSGCGCSASESASAGGLAALGLLIASTARRRRHRG